MNNNLDAGRSDDEIDLAEVFAILWAHKLAISFFTAVAIVIGGAYALTAPRVYVATTSFVFAQNDSSSSLGQLSSLAALAGISSGASQSQGLSLEEVFSSRLFIKKVSDATNLIGDVAFNEIQGPPTLTAWKETVKAFLGLKSAPISLARRQAESVVNSFAAFVTLNDLKSGAQTVSVKHSDPARAAEIANSVLDLLIVEVETNQEEAQSTRLNYLSSSLADALQQLDSTQENLKDYALSNNILSVEAFASQSVALDNLRKTRADTIALQSAADAVSAQVVGGNTSPEILKNIRARHVVLDDASFRRLFGMTEVISAWSWPSPTAAAAVASTLADRIKRLEGDIIKLEAEAQQFGRASEELAKLSRNAKVAEATYTVLIEQVKAQSLTAGYKQDVATVYDRAAVPLTPSEPKRSLIVALSAVLGAFVSVGLSLIISLRSDVYRTLNSLTDLVGSALMVDARGVRTFRRHLQSSSREKLRALSRASLSQWRIDVCEKPSNLVLIASLNARISSDTVAEWLAMRFSGEEQNVAVVNLRFDDPNISTTPSELFPPFLVAEVQGSGTHFLLPPSETPSEFYASAKFRATVEKLRSQFDRVIMACDGNDAETVVRAVRDQCPHVTLITRVGATKKKSIRQLGELIEVDACIHE